MSNRGRQIAASCLINELGLDWRYGAAFFEQQLIDYDMGSNYGNWQYIAGVGSDPRGKHFDGQTGCGMTLMRRSQESGTGFVHPSQNVWSTGQTGLSPNSTDGAPKEI